MTIKPLESIGDISFNESRTSTRNKLGTNFEAGVKEFGDIKDFYDHFIELGIFVIYDTKDMVSAVEFFDIPGPTFNGTDLLTISYNFVVQLLKESDPEIEEDGAGSFISYIFGIGGISSQGDELCESIIVFRKGYYDT